MFEYIFYYFTRNYDAEEYHSHERERQRERVRQRESTTDAGSRKWLDSRTQCYGFLKKNLQYQNNLIMIQNYILYQGFLILLAFNENIYRLFSNPFVIYLDKKQNRDRNIKQDHIGILHIRNPAFGDFFFIRESSIMTIRTLN